MLLELEREFTKTGRFKVTRIKYIRELNERGEESGKSIACKVSVEKQWTMNNVNVIPRCYIFVDVVNQVFILLLLRDQRRNRNP